MAPVQIAYPVPFYRQGRHTRVRLLVLHTAEGARTVTGLGSFLRRLGTASYHAAVDDERLAYYVNRRHTAWHCRSANPLSDGLCLTGFAAWSHDEWLRHPVMLESAAWWLASCARARGVPLRHLSLGEIRAAVRDPDHPGGVIAHWDWTRATGDGNHWDIGSDFPWSAVLARARLIQRGATPAPAPPPLLTPRLTEDMTMYLTTEAGAGEKSAWPRRKVLFGFDPGQTALLNLHWGFPGGWISDAKWWIRHAGADAPRKPAHIDLAQWADGGEQWGAYARVWTPPVDAEALELVFAAPGGLHIVPTLR